MIVVVGIVPATAVFPDGAVVGANKTYSGLLTSDIGCPVNVKPPYGDIGGLYSEHLHA